MNSKKIYLDYDPKYQGIVKTAAYLWFVCFAIFMLQVVLLISNLQLFNYASTGDWSNFLQMLSAKANQFALIKVGFLALRTIYVITCLGYIVAVWKINKSAALSFLGFTLVSLPVILIVQVFQLALVPLAHDYVSALAVPGITEAIKSSYLVSASLLYRMTDMGDAFVALLLFNGIFISWLFIAFQKPHPKWLGWWIIVLALLPFGRVIGMPILGLANAVLTGLFFVVMAFFMLRFEPLQKSDLK
jgi:hypothetical protein